MTEKEIKDLAREIAEYLYNEDKSVVLWWHNEPKERKAEEMELVLQFLSARCCLAEKSKLIEEYQFWKERLPKKFNLAKEVQNVPDTARMFGKIEILNDLFGKELFTDTEQ